MTTKNSFYAFAALAAMTLAGCNNDEEVIPQAGNPPITVTAGVTGLATRAGYEGTSSLPKTFYLTLEQDAVNSTSAYNYTNVAMTKDDGNDVTTYTPEKELLWIDDNTSRAPFVSAYTTNETTFTVQPDQSTQGGSAVDASDLLGAVKQANVTSDDITIDGNNITIKFRHLLCKLDLTYKWNGEMVEEKSKTIDGVTISGMNTKVNLNTTKAIVEDASTVGDIKAYVTSTNNGYLSEAIFAPSTAEPEVTITATINNVQRTFKATLTAPDGGFKSGNRYSTTLTIGKDVVTVSTVSVSAFDDAGNLADGETEQTTSLVLNASNLSAEDLKAAVAKALAATTSTHGLDITLASDAGAGMFTAIRRAICDANGVTDGSIALTLRGVTDIPDHSEFANEGNVIFGEVINDENGIECVTGLKSITLPDATSIGGHSFYGCGNLTEIVAPKVTTVGEYAFASCGLVSVELPEATTLESQAFYNCKGLTTIKLPKVTSLGNQALDTNSPESELTIYLTSDSDITVNKECFYWLVKNDLLSTKVNLVLNANKTEQVSGNTWTPSDGISFTFKSISFAE